MRELDIDLTRLNQAADEAIMKDVQDARARQIATKDPTPQVILFVLFVLWAGTFVLFYRSAAHRRVLAGSDRAGLRHHRDGANGRHRVFHRVEPR